MTKIMSLIVILATLNLPKADLIILVETSHTASVSAAKGFPVHEPLHGATVRNRAANYRDFML